MKNRSYSSAKKRPAVTTTRMAEIYIEMVFLRREYMEYCHEHSGDTLFFKMSDFWNWLCEGSSEFKIKKYRSDQTKDFSRRASIVALGNWMTLTVDERLFAKAADGDKFANYILAHEFGHLALGHSEISATKRNYLMSESARGMANIPATVEELEANLAAPFFQCGKLLEDARWDAVHLANRAFSDVYSVERAQKFVRLEIFQREVRRQLEEEVDRLSSIPRVAF